MDSGGAHGRLRDLGHVVASGIAFAQARHRDLGKADDDGEKIVEVLPSALL